MKIVTDNSRSKRVIDNYYSRSSVYRSFLRALASDSYTCDEQIASDIYNCHPSDQKYRRVKSEILVTICSALLSVDLDSKEHPQIRKQKFDTYKLMACIVLLISFKLKGLAVPLLRKLRNKANLYGLTDISLFCLEKLQYYALLDSDEKLYQKFSAEKEALVEIQMAEYKSWNAYMEMRRLLVTKSFLSSDDVAYCKQLELTAKLLADEYGSPRLIENYYHLAIAFALQTERQKKVMLLSTAFLSWLESNSRFSSNGRKAEYFFYQLFSSHALRDVKNGLETGGRALALQEDGSRDWFLTNELMFELAIYGEKYKTAFKIFNEVSNHPSLDEVHELHRQTWKVYEIFLRYVAPEFFTEFPILNNSFYLSNLTNDVPQLRQDKAGFGIMVWVASIIYLFRNLEIELLSQKIDAFYHYCTANKIQKSDPRAHYFSRVLSSIVNDNYTVKSVRSAKVKFQETVKNHKKQNRGGAIELIPYDVLFEFIEKDVAVIEQRKLVIIPLQKEMVTKVS